MKRASPFSLTGIKGCYILEFSLKRHQHLKLRSRSYDLSPGYYYYSGSAFGPGGLRARIRRHFRTDKVVHWNVDYLRNVSEITAVYYSPGNRENEHIAAGFFLQKPEEYLPIAHFGSSDCSCFTHLFFSQHSKQIERLFNFSEVRYRRISMKDIIGL